LNAADRGRLQMCFQNCNARTRWDAQGETDPAQKLPNDELTITKDYPGFWDIIIQTKQNGSWPGV